jgi:S1-C subfamily serine protease
MNPSSKRFLRDNLLGISLTLIGLLCAAAITVAYIERGSEPHLALAGGKALDGPDIDALRNLNKAFEQITQAVTPSIVSIQSTQVVKVQTSPFFSDPFFR